jgi:hypothetical protein
MKEESTKHEIPNPTPCRITESNRLGERDTDSGRMTKLPLLPSVFSLFPFSLILLIACDKGGSPTYEDGLNEGLRKGWEAGAKAMAEEMARQATEVRRLLREPMRGRLLVLAVVAAIMTLFGAKWADAARQRLAMRFQVPLPVQADLATALYLSAVMALLWYSLATCGLRDSIPVIILAGGSLIPFLDCRSALLAGDAPRRRAAFSRCKAMLMLGLVIVIVLRILSDDGFLNIQLGRAGSPRPFFSSETATSRGCRQSPRWQSCNLSL